MGRRRITNEILWKLVGIFEGRKRKIATSELAKIAKVSRCCARNAIARYLSTGSPCHHYSNKHQHRCTSSRQDRKLMKIVRENRRASLTDLRAVFQEQTGKFIGRSTIKRRCDSAGYHVRAISRKIQHTKEHRQARIKWCKERRNWGKKQWERIIWSDESAFQVHYRKGKVRIRRRKWEDPCNVPAVVGGGGTVMVWGCFKGNVSGVLVTTRKSINSAQYQKILENGLLPSLDLFPDLNFQFQQDNAPIHVSKSTKTWLANEGIDLLPWPAKSPDLNPIENLWDLMDRKLRKMALNSLDELELALHNAWLAIPQDTLKNLSNSMPDRVRKCLSRRGRQI